MNVILMLVLVMAMTIDAYPMPGGVFLFCVLDVIRVQVEIQWYIVERALEYVFWVLHTLILFVLPWVIFVLNFPQKAAEIHSYGLECSEQSSDVHQEVNEEIAKTSTGLPDLTFAEDNYETPITLGGEARRNFNPLKNWGMKDNEIKLYQVPSINAARCENVNFSVDHEVVVEKVVKETKQMTEDIEDFDNCLDMDAGNVTQKVTVDKAVKDTSTQTEDAAEMDWGSEACQDEAIERPKKFTVKVSVTDKVTESKDSGSVRNIFVSINTASRKDLLTNDEEDAMTPNIDTDEESVVQRRYVHTTRHFGSSLAAVGDMSPQPEHRDSPGSCWPDLSTHSKIGLLGLGVVIGFAMFKMCRLK